MARARAERARLSGRRRAVATERAAESDWRDFARWCAEVSRAPLPASAETVELYIAACSAERGHKVSTLRRRLWAIARRHKAAAHVSPVGDGARAVLSGVARERGTRPRQMAALSAEDVRRMSRALEPLGTAASVRDRAVILLGFATGFRRGELAALEVGDLEVTRRGVLVTLRRAKTDQAGLGRVVGVARGRYRDADPVGALREWLRVRGSSPGSLFGLSGQSIHQAVQAACALVGLAGEYGSHSLRAGMITTLDRQGVSVPAIMQRSGHKSLAIVARYVRNPDPFASDPLAPRTRRAG